MYIKQRKIERKPRPFIFTDWAGAKLKINKFKINKTFSVMKTFRKLTRYFVEGYLFGSRFARHEFRKTFVNSVLN